jgi:hypothetical protein
LNHSRRRPRSSCSSTTRPACSSASSRHRRPIRPRPTYSGLPAPPRSSKSRRSSQPAKKGENGALLPALEQILPGVHAGRIDRHGIIDSLADLAVVEAIEATGRRQLVTAGIGTEVCGWRRRSTLAATATTSPSVPRDRARSAIRTSSTPPAWHRDWPGPLSGAIPLEPPAAQGRTPDLLARPVPRHAALAVRDDVGLMFR